MQSLQEQQAPIDAQIVRELIAATPENWRSAKMTVERHQDGDTERVAISINSPEGHRELISATEEIIAAIYSLIDFFKQHGKIWAKAIYFAQLTSEDDWRFEATFEY